MNTYNLFFLIGFLFYPSIIADNAFTVTGGNCHNGFSGSDCPKQWFFNGGPGYTGQRVIGSENYHETEMICSPTCTDASNPKVCSLIMAFHGIYSNPGDQKWLMIGDGKDPEVYKEDEAHGGPFCISFHKAKDYAWEYKCGGDDEAYLVGFIEHALDNFPINPEAINIHGFSSGGIQVHHMMNTGCAIESYISAGSSYGSGNVPFAPTSKAAYLIAHGTHDRVVPYDAVWGSGEQIISCDCTAPGFVTPGGCIGTGAQQYLHLYGERLAGAIAQLRGWTGDYWGNAPGDSLPSISALLPVANLDLINEDAARCNTVYNECVVVSTGTLSPFNDYFDCANLGTHETDVIDFPIPAESNAGPVQVWKINIQNHNYPDKRRNAWGGTEFFFELRKFFHQNIGRQTFPPATRTMDEVAPNELCSSPDWIGDIGPNYVNRHINWDITSAEKCRDRCLAERKCVEAFFFDFDYGGTVRGCAIHYEELPCSSTFGASWANAKHYKVTTVLNPTLAPISSPTPAPVESPTPAPVGNPPLCDSPGTFVGSNSAGYACLVDGVSESDSNWGGTEASCSDIGGVWTPYDCFAAEAYYLGLDVNDPMINEFKSTWAPKCCETVQSPTPAPVGKPPICDSPGTFVGSNSAGYACLVDGVSESDSNWGGTEASCSDIGGDWTHYDCNTAEDFYSWLPVDDPMINEFKSTWAPKCCEKPPICDSPGTFVGSNSAGYACLVDGNASEVDSNWGGTEASCSDIGGVWTPYDCFAAEAYYLGLDVNDPFIAEFKSAWAPQCCTCRDYDRRFPSEGTKKNCFKNIRPDPETRCEVQGVREYCPVTCNKDCMPKDNQEGFKFKGVARNCEWVSQLPNDRCKKNRLRSNCPETCLGYTY